MLLPSMNTLKEAVWGEVKDDETNENLEARKPVGKYAKTAGMCQLVK